MMNFSCHTSARTASAVALTLACIAVVIGDDASDVAPVSTTSVDEARRQAEILHEAMHHTLHVVHHELYREDEGLPIPAEIMKDVFTELEAEKGVSLRWLAVEGQAMNTDHKPRDAFEREAFTALESGEASYEKVDAGVYRRAGRIVLTNHCLKCHVPDRKDTEDRTAGLIISMPVE